MSRRPDPIIEEIHEVRREIAKRFGGDIRKISADAQERQRREGRPVWRPEESANETSKPTADSVQRNG